jgi:polyisoprenoid-binding protein YceI
MKTFHSIALSTALLSGVASILFAQPLNYALSDANGKKQIMFESKAAVEYMEGVAGGISGTVTMDAAKPDLALQAEVSVPVDRMRTGNDMRDEHMRSDVWLNAAKYPGIRFELTPGSGNAVTKKSEGVWAVKANGRFTLKGISKQVTVPLTIKQTGKQISIAGRFSVHLEDYGVNGPIGIKMIGMKVSPDVQIILNLVGVQDPGWGALPVKR